jgi:hypothetical protein
MGKAHKITASNESGLADQFDVDVDDLAAFRGSYLVTGFGGHRVNGFIDEPNIKKFFVVTEINLEEGTFDIQKKELVGK